MSRYHIPMPIISHRFKLTSCPDQVALNASNVSFNFVDKTISMQVRLAGNPQCWVACETFSRQKFFDVELMDGSKDGIFYALRPLNIKLTDHSLSFDYAVNAPVMHNFVWTYDYVDVMVHSEQAGELEPITDFPDPATAMAQYEEAKGK